VDENGRRLERAWFLRSGYCGRGCLHPHVHCVVPAGGLSLDHTHWIKSRSRFFLSIKVLRRVFRGKFVAALRQAFHHGRLRFHGNLTPLTQPNTFAAWLRSLFRKDWVVYAKRPFGGPEYVLQYLGRYTHRVAISNHRLVSFADGQVTFRWRDSAHNNEQKLMTLELDEFLRRFLLHLLPEGFVRIRNFGFLANRRRSTLLPLCFQLLGTTPQPPAEEHSSSTEDAAELYRCPHCGGPMKVIERLTAAEIQFRSPARIKICCMKPLSPTQKLCVPRHAPYLSGSPPKTFFLQRLQRQSSRCFVAVANFRARPVMGCALQHCLGEPQIRPFPN